MKPLSLACTALAVSALFAPHSLGGGYTLKGFTGDGLGHVVVPFDDVNGDGCDDFLVGSPEYSSGRGLGQIRSGKDGSTLIAKIGAPSSGTGWSMSRAGDVNNDGRPDFLLGAPDTPGGGIAFVYSSDGQFIRSHMLPDHRFGTSVADLGDVNGDGYDDYAIGSDTDQFDLLKGRVYAYSGQTGAFLWVSLGAQTKSYYGHSMCRVGDLNNDGCDDLAVGAPEYDYGFPFSIPEAGAVRYVSGKDGLQIRVVSGITGWEHHLGTSVAPAGDYNNDGVEDVIAGAPDYDTSDAGGAAFVLSGANGSTLMKMTSAFLDEEFGASVAGAGDINGNGQLDYIVGAPMANFGAGKVQIMSGSGAILQIVNGTDGKTGATVASGDFNGDGNMDLMYGSPEKGVADEDGEVVVDFLCPVIHRNYGTGHPGTLGVPSLTLNADPLYGTVRKLQIGNSRGVNTFGLELIGLSPVSVPTSKDGTLLVNFLWTVFHVLPPSGKSVSFTLPASPAVCDASLFVQMLVLDPGASRGIAFSPGLEMRFGDLPSN